MPGDGDVLLLTETGELPLERVLQRYQLRLQLCASAAEIPGSYWGAPEAGLIGQQLFARPDTPVHSILHEACHYICMPAARRAHLHTNAAGDYDEENCVCYLQIILADFVTGMGRNRMFTDMDAWGYSFRLGSARAWFENDARDAATNLHAWGILDAAGEPAWRLRGAPGSGEADARRA